MVLDDKAKELRRAYQREYYRKNKEKRKKYNIEYWQRKARECKGEGGYNEV